MTLDVRSSLKNTRIPEHTSVTPITVEHVEGEDKVSADFTITHYKLDEVEYPLPRNIIGLCAKASIAELITGRYLRTKTLENNAIDGHYHIVLVEGALLDEGVNEQRDGFDKIPLDDGSDDLFGGMQVTFEDIFSVLDDKVQELITPPDWSRDAIVNDVAQDFGVSEEMLSYSSTRVKFGDTPNEVAKRVLTNLQEQVVNETSSLSAMKEAIKGLAPDSEDFRRQIDDLSWEYASSLKTIDMANLSQLVVRRSALIDVLDLAVNEGLKVQTELPDPREDHRGQAGTVPHPALLDGAGQLPDRFRVQPHLATVRPELALSLTLDGVLDAELPVAYGFGGVTADPDVALVRAAG